MQKDTLHLGGINALAARFGDGLKPEFARLLEGPIVPVGKNIVALNIRQHSSGPSHQTVSQDQLKEMDIPQIGSSTAPNDAKKDHRAHG